MQADWEFEADGAAPVIDACWPGFVDLRQAPERVNELCEARQCRALAAALVRLNAPGSAVWTSKCDYFPLLQPGEFDPDELDSSAIGALHACGCYIDLLSAADREWDEPTAAATACKHWCMRLRGLPPRSSRVDLVIRRAFVQPGRIELGITAYLTACGASSEQAAAALTAALAAFAAAVSAAPIPCEPIIKLE